MKDKIKIIICTLLTVLATFTDYESIYQNNMHILKYHYILFIISLVLVYIFYSKFKYHQIHYLKKILAGLFTIFMIFGYSYNKIASWDLVFGNLKMFILSLLAFIGYYILFMRIFSIIDDVLKKKISLKENIKKNKLLIYIDEHPFISSMIIILLFWLIYVIAYYPIILSPDPSFQIRQFFNVHTKYADWVNLLDENVFITNHHPFIHTLLLGGCLKLGRLLINDNFGLFIYSIIQILILASALSYTVYYLKKLNVNSKTRLFLILIYSLVPMFPFYAMSGVKDTIYTAFIILYVIFLFEFIRNYKNKQLNIKQIILFIMLLLLVSLFRNNGLYVIVLSFPFIIFYSKENRKNTISIFVIFLMLFMTYSKLILPSLKITDGSIREMLSIPFQQTARYVTEFEEELSTTDIEIIDNILNYKTIKKDYDPEFADPIKNKFKKDATSDDLKAYFNVWLNGLLKHPNVYIESTINNTYGYFYPGDTNWYIYYSFDSRITKDNLVDYHYNDLSFLRKILMYYGQAYPYIPIIGLLSIIGFNTWILMIMGVYYFTANKKKYIITLMPFYITLLICIASPVNTYFRYAMPYIFAMPALVIMFIYIIREEENV